MFAPILLKVPLLVIGTLGPHIGVTPPNPPASKEEKNGFGKGSKEVMSSTLIAYWSPYFLKVIFFATCISLTDLIPFSVTDNVLGDCLMRGHRHPRFTVPFDTYATPSHHTLFIPNSGVEAGYNPDIPHRLLPVHNRSSHPPLVLQDFGSLFQVRTFRSR